MSQPPEPKRQRMSVSSPISSQVEIDAVEANDQVPPPSSSIRFPTPSQAEEWSSSKEWAPSSSPAQQPPSSAPLPLSRDPSSSVPQSSPPPSSSHIERQADGLLSTLTGAGRLHPGPPRLATIFFYLHQRGQ